MNDDQTPDREFVSRLEWELESTMRRQGSLNGTSGAMRSVRRRLGTTLALVVASMLAGGAGTHAVTHRVDKEAAALYVARGEALVEIAQTRLDHFAREMAATQARVAEGIVTQREARGMEAEYSHAESEATFRELGLAETLITGKEPNDALSAPLVDGRDFVTERLAVLRRPLQMRLDFAADQALRQKQLVDSGLATAEETAGFAAHIGNMEQELVGHDKRIALRASFLSEELTAAAVELQGMRFAAVTARDTALRQVELLAQHHARLTALSQQGAVSDSELRGIQAELRASEAHVDLAELELRILDDKLEGAAKE